MCRQMGCPIFTNVSAGPESAEAGEGGLLLGQLWGQLATSRARMSTVQSERQTYRFFFPALPDECVTLSVKKKKANL